jgi:hypothetical protein
MDSILGHLQKRFQLYLIGLALLSIAGLVTTGVIIHGRLVDRLVSVEAQNEVLRNDLEAQSTTIDAQGDALERWEASTNKNAEAIEAFAKSDATARQALRRIERQLAEKPLASLPEPELRGYVDRSLGDAFGLLECASTRGSDCISSDDTGASEAEVAGPGPD